MFRRKSLPASLEENNNMEKKKLEKLRSEIDRIDGQVVSLLNKRGSISSMIGDIKKAGKSPIYSSDRESSVYKAVTGKNKGP